MNISVQPITYVAPDSPAARCGIRAGDALLAINGEPVRDLIDYEKLTAERILHVDVCREGKTISCRVKKEEYEPLGLSFETSLMSRMQTCKNHCVFCFIDQMPRGVRSSLQVKDDDWRMSFIMGNYVTLTNVDDEEFDRILRRRVSPLYVSVHAIDPVVRTRIMKNPSAGRIRERLEALKAAGIQFHAQIVLCPGINDGAILAETLTVLGELAPATASVAIVPVGVTKFREKLEHLDTFDREGSKAVIEQVSRFQSAFLQKLGTRLVFCFACLQMIFWMLSRKRSRFRRRGVFRWRAEPPLRRSFGICIGRWIRIGFIGSCIRFRTDISAATFMSEAS